MTDSMISTKTKGLGQLTLRMPEELLEAVKTRARRATGELNLDVTFTDVILACIKQKFGTKSVHTGEPDYLLEGPLHQPKKSFIPADDRVNQIMNHLSRNPREEESLAIQEGLYIRFLAITANGAILKKVWADNVCLKGGGYTRELYGEDTTGKTWVIPVDQQVKIIRVNGYTVELICTC